MEVAHRHHGSHGPGAFSHGVTELRSRVTPVTQTRGEVTRSFPAIMNSNYGYKAFSSVDQDLFDSVERHLQLSILAQNRRATK